eukprot:TRINITY_DN66762_c8_g3_i1.p1 TRINITY_DN66762_c8_g3~~TRINITY_DN66762_c8_g3_i1.p1  ORF type:complete len:304 (+),score=168.00 TRINITY_DN66762_c8_g3_i1:65-913(+)
MSADPQLESALSVMRRMPPSATENSLAGLIELSPQLTDELLTHVDQPLKVAKDPKTGRQYILCDYNRDGDSYRSPWSNEYFPEMEDGFHPTSSLRAMEIEANNMFDVYRKLYFDTGYSSVYYFNTEEKEEDGFGCCFLIHKDVKSSANLTGGVWDSVHVFEVKRVQGNKYEYKLTTTVMVAMKVNNDKVGKVDLSGSMTKQESSKRPVDKNNPHISNMGTMLEEMERRIRNTIEAIYIQKTREVINGMRSANAAAARAWESMTESLNAAVLSHGNKRNKDSD